MRVIQAFDQPVHAVALSPDGQFVAASSADELVVHSWSGGEKISSAFAVPSGGQIAFSAKSEVLVYTNRPLGLLWFVPTATAVRGRVAGDGRGPFFAGGLAMSPDGKTLVATRTGSRQQVKLERWSFPGWRPLSGFDFWSPFERLAFSPNGEFLAGINDESFELRIAVTGGLNGRQWPREASTQGFLTFPRHGETVAFGWDGELQIMETRAGKVLHRIAARGQSFEDAVFTGNGEHLATVDGTSVMQVWSAETWQVTRAYDWQAGGLTCIACTTDGLAGVCGTTTGQLIAFDVEE
jgi:WD40 repeat protein